MNEAWYFAKDAFDCGCLTYVAPESNLVLLNQASNLPTGHRR